MSLSSLTGYIGPVSNSLVILISLCAAINSVGSLKGQGTTSKWLFALPLLTAVYCTADLTISLLLRCGKFDFRLLSQREQPISFLFSFLKLFIAFSCLSLAIANISILYAILFVLLLTEATMSLCEMILAKVENVRMRREAEEDGTEPENVRVASNFTFKITLMNYSLVCSNILVVICSLYVLSITFHPLVYRQEANEWMFGFALFMLLFSLADLAQDNLLKDEVFRDNRLDPVKYPLIICFTTIRSLCTIYCFMTALANWSTTYWFLFGIFLVSGSSLFVRHILVKLEDLKAKRTVVHGAVQESYNMAASP